jgi:RHS repeat-associated protein
MLRALLLLLLLASPVAAGRSDSLGFTNDAAGNVVAEAWTGGGTYGYTYNAAGRMESFSINGFLQASYKYDAMGRQAIRTLTAPSPVTIHSVFDSQGRRIAEYNETSGALIREYVWNGWDPVAVIEGGVISFVRADHIGRPVFATDASGAKMWEVSYLPFGGVRVATGSPTASRFPGHWFQSESGLHQNWMRDYDPTTGRYLQADPLGLVDGASVYGYVGQSPMRFIDPRGEQEIPFNPGLPGEFRPNLTGAGKFWENYAKMKEANWKNSDKYFRCKANCEATQCVTDENSILSGYQTSVIFSTGREVTDTIRKLQSFDDWRADEGANSTGREGARSMPGASCQEICERYRPNGLPKEY